MQILTLIKFHTGATDRPWPISAMLKSQDSCSIRLKKGSFLGPKKSENMTHEIERTGMMNINILN